MSPMSPGGSDPVPTPYADGGTPAATGPRRRLLWAGAGAALAAGAGLGWWLRRGSAGDDAAAQLLWSQSFETPAGAPLDWQAVRGSGPLLVNFWATWCPPCVAELPMLDAFGRAQAATGWRVLGLAVDQPSAVRNFLAKRPVAFAVAMAGLQGTELSRSLGNTQGGLPFTVVFAPNGSVLQRKIGQLSESDLQAWV